MSKLTRPLRGDGSNDGVVVRRVVRVPERLVVGLIVGRED